MGRMYKFLGRMYKFLGPHTTALKQEYPRGTPHYFDFAPV